MLKSLWLRLVRGGPVTSDERALARYFRIEGMHAELDLLQARGGAGDTAFERTLYRTHSYFAA